MDPDTQTGPKPVTALTTCEISYARQFAWGPGPIPPKSILCGVHEGYALFWVYREGWRIGQGGLLHPDHTEPKLIQGPWLRSVLATIQKERVLVVTGTSWRTIQGWRYGRPMPGKAVLALVSLFSGNS